MSRVILVRHGETALLKQARYSGQQDTSLTPLGDAQHARLRERLRDETIARIVSSDLECCLSLAMKIAADHVLAAEPEPALREASFGLWEGLTYEVAMARDRKAMVAFNRDPVNNGPPGGESLAQFVARVRPCFDALVREQHDRPGALLLVGHGGTVRALLCSLLTLPLERHWMLRADPASLTALDTYPLGPIVAVLNDTCHLVGLET